MVLSRHPAWCALLAVGLYAASVGFGFVAIDDPWLIEENPLLTTEGGLDVARVLVDFKPETRMILGAEFLPVRDVSTWLDGRLFGAWVGGRHLINVLLYGLAVALFAVLALRLLRGSGERGRAAAWMSTFIFTVHPTHVEAVAWLSERKGLLSLCFVLAASIAAHRYAAHGRHRELPLSLGLYFLGILSKSVSVVAPLMMAANVLILPTRSARRRALWLTLLACVVGAAWIQPTLWVGSQLNVIQSEHQAGLLGKALLSCELHGRYLALMFLAAPNAPHYLVDAAELAPGFAALGGVAFLVLVAVILWWRRWPMGAYGAIWWLAPLLPVSHLVFPLQNLMADRYLLLPSVGFALLLGDLLSRLSAKLRLIPAAAYCLVAAALVMLQLPTWKNSEALFRRLVDLQPQVDSHWSQWAAHLAGKGASDRALVVTHEGIERAGPSAALLHRRGLLRLRRGDHEGGFSDIERAAKKHDAAPKYQANYALLLLQRGRVEEADRYATQAVERAPLYAHIQRVFGMVRAQRGDRQNARLAFEKALALEPHNPVNRQRLEELEH